MARAPSMTPKSIAMRGLKEAKAHLQELAARAEDQGPAWKEIAQYLEDLARLALGTQGFDRWAPHSNATVDKYGPHQIGRLSGAMGRSLEGVSGEKRAALETPGLSDYPRIFHGGALGERNRTRLAAYKVRVNFQKTFIGPVYVDAVQPRRPMVPLRSKHTEIRLKLQKYLLESRNAKKAAGGVQ